MTAAPPVTALLADYALSGRFEDFPAPVRAHAVRAFFNWIGCTLGGSGEDVSRKVAAAQAPGTAASALGMGCRSDMAGAAFVNCVSSSALAYDDTHLATVTHPTGPVAAALLALAETQPVSGTNFLAALTIGIEIQCRLSNAILMPPACGNVALYITGVTGPVGAAAAMGRLMGFDAATMRSALGLAAAQAAGFRATHTADAGLVVPAFGARTGIFAAELAASGVTCTDNALEAPKGFIRAFDADADPAIAVEGLGERYEMLANTYKPYPCGIVVQPVVDACLAIAPDVPPGTGIKALNVTAHPLTLDLSDRRHPATPLEAQISFQHWAAAALLRGQAGIAEMRAKVIADPTITALRDKVTGVADERFARDAASAELLLSDGTRLRADIPHARGSLKRPMTSAELDAKFDGQARMVLDGETADRLRSLLYRLPELDDVGRDVAALCAARTTDSSNPEERTTPCA